MKKQLATIFTLISAMLLPGCGDKNNPSHPIQRDAVQPSEFSVVDAETIRNIFIKNIGSRLGMFENHDSCWIDIHSDNRWISVTVSAVEKDPTSDRANVRTLGGFISAKDIQDANSASWALDKANSKISYNTTIEGSTFALNFETTTEQILSVIWLDSNSGINKICTLNSK